MEQQQPRHVQRDATVQPESQLENSTKTSAQINEGRAVMVPVTDGDSVDVAALELATRSAALQQQPGQIDGVAVNFEKLDASPLVRTTANVPARDTSIIQMAGRPVSITGNPEWLERWQELPPEAKAHLAEHPFTSPERVGERAFWLEGTFDPIGPHHLRMLLETWDMGFERGVFAMVFQNPYKPKSTPYAQRREMAKLAIESVGLVVTNDPTQPGVCIFEDVRDFHLWRRAAIYGENWNIVIGPDNFAKARNANVVWTHEPEVAANPAGRERYDFNRMYEAPKDGGADISVPGFKSSLLVYDKLPDIHATDIRKGVAPSLTVVDQYAAANGLYLSDPTRDTANQKPQRLERRHQPSALEVQAREEVFTTVSTILHEHGMLNHRVTEAVRTVVADLDVSEVLLLQAELERVSQADELGILTKKILESGSGLMMPKRYNGGADSTISELRDRVFDALVGTDLETDGREHVIDALLAQQRIVFVGNHGGWADLGFLPVGLEAEGLGAIADKLSFVVKEEIFPNAALKTLMGKSVGVITPDVDDSSIKKAVEYGVKRLSQGDTLAIFPEAQPSDNGLGLFREDFLAGFTAKELASRGLDPEQVVLIPWVQRGSSAVGSGSGTNFTADHPAMVRFGERLSIADIHTVARERTPEIAAHVIGLLVAEKLPPQHRGVYGQHAEGYLEHNDPDRRITRKDLEAIEQARGVLALLRSEGTNTLTH